jgi:hypothetical protein
VKKDLVLLDYNKIAKNNGVWVAEESWEGGMVM